MRKRSTTICCSAVALTLALQVVPNLPVPPPGDPSARTTAPPPPASLFPAVLRWTLTLDEAVSGRPAFDGSRAFVPLGQRRLAAFDLRQGKELWRVEHAEPEAMVAADGRVLVIAGGLLSALDAGTGRPLWTHALDSSSSALPTAGYGWVILGQGRAMTGLRAEDGAVIWSGTVDATILHAPAVSGERLYVALEDGRIAAVRLRNGSLVWTRRLGGPPQPVLALGARLYVGAADNFFYCLRAVDGEVLWRWRTGADIVGAAVHDDARVYFASKDNVLRALDANTGAQRWKRPLPLRPTSGPVRVGETLVLAGLGASVLGFHPKDGAAAGEVDVGGALVAPTIGVNTDTLFGSLLVSIARTPAGGTKLIAVSRDLEPPARPIVPLPNPAPMERLPGSDGPADRTRASEPSAPSK